MQYEYSMNNRVQHEAGARGSRLPFDADGSQLVEVEARLGERAGLRAELRVNLYSTLVLVCVVCS